MLINMINYWQKNVALVRVMDGVVKKLRRYLLLDREGPREGMVPFTGAVDPDWGFCFCSFQTNLSSLSAVTHQLLR